MIRKNIKKIITVLLVVLVLSGCKKTPTQEVVPAFTETVNETITIMALGDNLLHMPVINSGRKADGTFDYTHLFDKLQPEIRDTDISVIGQETVFAGKELGYSGYPLFNSPSDMGKTLVNEGFDVVLHASNHVMDKYAAGIEKTLEFWADYPDVTVLGINRSDIDKYTVDIKEVKGAKIAMLNYTYGTNGINVPADKEYLVNLIDEEKIQADAAYAEDNADFTVAFMHWGTEYSVTPDQQQKDLAEKMCQWGVDLIIGSHPHVIEPVEWITSENGNEMLVYYSLGNFVSRQLEARNLLGGVANVSLNYDGEKVVISDYSFMPIVTHYDTTYTQFDVYPLKEYSNDIAPYHGVASHDGAVSVERFRNMVDETFEGYDVSVLDY